jgi:hypothetical protein
MGPGDFAEQVSASIGVAAVAVLSVAVIVVVVGASARVSGAPSTSGSTHTTHRSAAPTTAAVSPYPFDDPNPWKVYPGRPGAEYDDIEAHPNAPVSLGVVQVRVLGWAVVARRARPAGSKPANLGVYSQVGLVDGFAPSTTHNPGDTLRVTLRSTAFASSIHCVGVAATDGTVLVPYDEPVAPPVHSTTSTLFERGPRDVTYYLPLGTRRGRVYFTCDVPLILSDWRAVWGLDV